MGDDNECACCGFSLEFSSTAEHEPSRHQECISIQCDHCERWFHLKCSELEEYEIEDIDRFHCLNCEPICGPTTYKIVTNCHRNDRSEEGSADKKTECGTVVFVESLKNRLDFANGNEIVKEFSDGFELTFGYLESVLFTNPLLIHNIAGLNISLPNLSTCGDLANYIDDPDLVIDVIDCCRQKDFKMKFATLLRLYRTYDRRRIYNMISLEFSKTKLGPLVSLPTIVEEISWVHRYWPKPSVEHSFLLPQAYQPLNDHINLKPEVSKFCLLSMRDSYTDFHVDFGGSSVWYHVIWGEKIFYLIEPTKRNLDLYVKWMHSKNKSERFFGDEVDKCYMCRLKDGQTFFIPTGWIHAVLTIQDSLVFGGNFLHNFNIPLQLRIYEIELHSSTHDKYMFPNFELLNWYAGYHFLDTLNEHNDENKSVKRYLRDGIVTLIERMKTWLKRGQLESSNSRKYVEKIESLSFVQIAKKLEKALKLNCKLSHELRVKRKLNSASSSSLVKYTTSVTPTGFNLKTTAAITDVATTPSKTPLKLIINKKDLIDMNRQSSGGSLDISPKTSRNDVNHAYSLNGSHSQYPDELTLKTDHDNTSARLIVNHDTFIANESCKSLPVTLRLSLKSLDVPNSNDELTVSHTSREVESANKTQTSDDDDEDEDGLNQPPITIKLSKIFGISKRGRLQKLNPSISDSVEFEFDEKAITVTSNCSKEHINSKNINELASFKALDQASNLVEHASDDEIAFSTKMKKRKPSTTRERLAHKLKLK